MIYVAKISYRDAGGTAQQDVLGAADEVEREQPVVGGAVEGTQVGEVELVENTEGAESGELGAARAAQRGELRFLEPVDLGDIDHPDDLRGPHHEAVVGQQPFGGGRASGTNDKAGSKLNLTRWVSARTIKETFSPPRDYRYPYMSEA